MIANEVFNLSIGECKVVFASENAQTDETSSNMTSELQGVSFFADDDIREEDDVPSGALPCQLPPKKLIIDMPGNLGKMMILGRPFLATIHARIDVFNGENSLGIVKDRIMFDMDENTHHPKEPEVERKAITRISDLGPITSRLHYSTNGCSMVLILKLTMVERVATRTKEGLTSTRKRSTARLNSWGTNMICGYKEKEGGRSFVCVTKQLDDDFPLGRANGSRFKGMIRKELDGDRGIQREIKTQFESNLKTR
nr:hypothetical protein [Tanacetum cinerariifolium]